MKFIAVVLLFILCTQTLFAQYKILLSHKELGKENYIKKGYKVIYKIKNCVVKTAKIKDITAQNICTRDDTFAISDVEFIGFEKSNTALLKMGATLSYYGSFVNLFIAYLIYTHAPGYVTIGNFFAFMGIVPMVISKQIMNLNDYILFDLTYQWDARIVAY